MYELSLEITIPSTNTSGTAQTKEIDLKDYNIKDALIIKGYFKLSNDVGTILNLPVWISGNNTVRAFYQANNNKLVLSNSTTSYNGAKGYVTLQYSKKDS